MLKKSLFYEEIHKENRETTGMRSTNSLPQGRKGKEEKKQDLPYKKTTDTPLKMAIKEVQAYSVDSTLSNILWGSNTVPQKFLHFFPTKGSNN